MKILPVAADLFHADGRTDMTKIIVAIRNFVNAPKNDVHTVPCCLKWHRCFKEKYVTMVGSKTDYQDMNSYE